MYVSLVLSLNEPISSIVITELYMLYISTLHLITKLLSLRINDNKLYHIISTFLYLSIFTHCHGYDGPVMSGTGGTMCITWHNETACWGRNVGGTCGSNEGDIEIITPTAAVDLPDGFIVKETNCGSAAVCCALNYDGGVICWGANDNGRLGVNHTENIGDDPDEMGDNLNVLDFGDDFIASKVRPGGWHTCVLSTNGKIKCFGSNNSGQLGLGVSDGYKLLTQGNSDDNLVDLGTGFTAIDIAAGDNHACALRDDFSIVCWGQCEYYALGDGTGGSSSCPARGKSSDDMGDNLIPLVFDSGFVPTAFVKGRQENIICAQSNDLSVWCWGGKNMNCTTICSDISSCTPTSRFGLPREIDTGFTDLTDICNGRAHMCAVSSAGLIRCWGQAAYGAIGSEDQIDRLGCDGSVYPTIDINFADSVIGVDCATNFNCAYDEV